MNSNLIEQDKNGLYSLCVHNAQQPSDDEVREVFEKFGPIVQLHRCKTLVFIRYSRLEEAKECYEQMLNHPNYCVRPANQRNKEGSDSTQRQTNMNRQHSGSGDFRERRFDSGDSSQRFEGGGDSFGKRNSAGGFTGNGNQRGGENFHSRRSEGGRFNGNQRSDGENYGRRSDGDRFSRGESSNRWSGGASFNPRPNQQNGFSNVSTPSESKLPAQPLLVPITPPLPRDTVETIKAKEVVIGNIPPYMKQNDIYDLSLKTKTTPIHVEMKVIKRPNHPTYHYAVCYVKSEEDVKNIVTGLHNIKINGYQLIVDAAHIMSVKGKKMLNVK